jgi:GH24 family phage-related lysozyme (muramidase)
MRKSVSDIFAAFSTTFEGRIETMYTDVKNLVTVGVGCLIDPIETAIHLPWTTIPPTAISGSKPAGKHGTALAHSTPVVPPKGAELPGVLATEDQIRVEWCRVKSGGFALRGWRAAAKGAKLKLTDASLDALTVGRMTANDVILAKRFDGWEELPANVQLAVHSVAWACGVYFKFKNFQAAIAKRDWKTCADECQMSAVGIPGLVPRNAADKKLFLAAAEGGDLDKIAWP